MIIACMGCHLHWLAVLLLPVALWVMKIFRHKGKKCPCDCHKNSMDKALRPVKINTKKPKCKPPKPMTETKGSYIPSPSQVLPPKRTTKLINGIPEEVYFVKKITKNHKCPCEECHETKEKSVERLDIETQEKLGIRKEVNLDKIERELNE